jgi:DNA-binding CsgD family transcriptional regulator
MSRHYLNFTPMEIQVANMVKAGKTTKDIALILGLSARTIEAVRYAIRRKLGIKKKRSNLRSYLLSIDIDRHHFRRQRLAAIVQQHVFGVRPWSGACSIMPQVPIGILGAGMLCFGQFAGFMKVDRRPLLHGIFQSPQT